MFDDNNSSTNFFENFESFEENLRMIRLNVINDNSLDSKQKIIKSYEIEYEYLENQIKALIYSNDEMSKFDINDEIIMESRAENLKFMQNYLTRLNKIRSEIIALDSAHPIIDVTSTLIQINEKNNITTKNNQEINKEEYEDKSDLNNIDINDIKDKDEKGSYEIENRTHNTNIIINEINL